MSIIMETQINQLLKDLRQLANTPNIMNTPFGADTVSNILINIITVANNWKKIDIQIVQQLLAAKNILFSYNRFGQGFINPIALGEIIFGLDYLKCKEQTQNNSIDIDYGTADFWPSIHPLIYKSSKKLFEDGYYANAAEDAFIEFNCRAKGIYRKLVPNAKDIPDGTDLMHKLFGGNSPICPVCDISTESGNNFQQGFHFMTAGAMSALRNPKAHSNDEILTKGEAIRRLMFASMLMCKLDETGL